MQLDQSQIERIVALAQKHGATRLILFGSALEHPERARDLDLACDGVTGWELYRLGGLLEEMLRTSVDLVPLRPVTPFTRLIENRGKVLYDAERPAQ
jgi:predicted nucleotidyltransferase